MNLKTASRLVLGALLLVAAATQAGAAAMLQAPGGGTVRAVVIGVDQYPNLPASVWLNGAVPDALDLSNALKTSGVDVRSLIDLDATRTHVLEAMDRLVADSKAGDMAVIAYSGHGMRVRAYPQWKGLDGTGTQSQMVLSGFSRTGPGAHEIIVDRELRAWLARLDAKGVDVLVVTDACYVGATNARGFALFKVRALDGDADERAHDSFVGIQMTQVEARTNVRNLSHVTFLAGASQGRVVPEIVGIDHASPKGSRGALSYFVGRAMEGLASNGGDLTRETMFKFLSQNVRQATDEQQFIDFEPRLDAPESLNKVVFRLRDVAASAPAPAAEVGAIRVAIANGPAAAFDTIKKSHAPFVRSERSQADLIWDVGASTASSQSDLVTSQVDGELMGRIIDRTWAIREIQTLSQPRVLEVRMRDEGRTFTVGDHPEIMVDELSNNYLAVFNIAADGTVQVLFPWHENALVAGASWSYKPPVRDPFGADLVVAVATSAPATELVDWLTRHDETPDAAELPGLIAKTIAADAKTRIGTVGLYTTAKP